MVAAFRECPARGPADLEARLDAAELPAEGFPALLGEAWALAAMWNPADPTRGLSRLCVHARGTVRCAGVALLAGAVRWRAEEYAQFEQDPVVKAVMEGVLAD